MPVHMKLLAAFATATGLCVWTGYARAQGSAETDRVALVALYRATGGDNWTNNAKWLTAAPLADWYGVETNEQGRVTGLRLGGWDEAAREVIGNGLVGSLPAEIGTLSDLRRLEVGGNSGLTGPIPAAVGNLSNLESLFLQNNWLTGSIPAALGRLVKLDWIGLDSNALTGSIPTALGNLTKPSWSDAHQQHAERAGSTRIGEPRPPDATGPRREHAERTAPRELDPFGGHQALAARRQRPVRAGHARHAGVGGRDPGFHWSLLHRVGDLLARRHAAG